MPVQSEADCNPVASSCRARGWNQGDQGDQEGPEGQWGQDTGWVGPGGKPCTPPALPVTAGILFFSFFVLL